MDAGCRLLRDTSAAACDVMRYAPPLLLVLMVGDAKYPIYSSSRHPISTPSRIFPLKRRPAPKPESLLSRSVMYVEHNEVYLYQDMKHIASPLLSAAPAAPRLSMGRAL